MVQASIPQATTTECVTDLGLQLEMIIFEPILTTFEINSIFWA